MTAVGANPLERFARAHGLDSVDTPDLPSHGDTLNRAHAEAGPAVHGALPGGLQGTLAHYDYTTTDNDGHHYHHPMTLVVSRVPESIGFAPYLGFSGAVSRIDPTGATPGEVEPVDAAEEALGAQRLFAYKGTSDEWLRELFSPALLDWLARSPDDFGFELADGTLVAARNEHLTDTRVLEALCTDAAHLAQAIEREAVEESSTGGAAHAAATTIKTPDDVMVETALGKFGDDREVPSADSAVPAFRSLIRRNPGTWVFKLLSSVFWLAIFNVPAIVVPILLIHGDHIEALFAFEVGLLSLIYFIRMRAHIRDKSKLYAEEAFFRAYARDRDLTLEDPLRFAATHAEAELPFKPERVLAGGPDGTLALSGDGAKRTDRIALVAGARGPVATATLEVSPPCIRARDLDDYTERLARELGAARS